MDPNQSPALPLSHLPQLASPPHAPATSEFPQQQYQPQKRPYSRQESLQPTPQAREQPHATLGSPFPHYGTQLGPEGLSTGLGIMPSQAPPLHSVYDYQMPTQYSASKLPTQYQFHTPQDILLSLSSRQHSPQELRRGQLQNMARPPRQHQPMHTIIPQTHEATPPLTQPQPRAHLSMLSMSSSHLETPQPHIGADLMHGHESFVKSEDFSYDVAGHLTSMPPERPLSLNSDHHVRKMPRTDSGDESDNQLKTAAMKASAFPLSEVAVKVKLLDSNDSAVKADPLFEFISNSRDLKQEKHLQLFAMVWIYNSCEASHTAVIPRNRIYARYVHVCANYKLNPLTPANFGKLVRLIFPNLKTRRLGMRGKSKYHYCGLKLVGDQSQDGSPMSSYSSAGVDSPQSIYPHTPSLSGSPAVSQLLGTPVSNIQVQDYFQSNDLKYLPNLFTDIELSVNSESMNQPLNLPSIYQYLPKDYDGDYDIADTLHSLYRVHCTSIFELMRYMQIDKMFSLFFPFPAISTAPVFKLLKSECIAEWVRDCDLVMYRAMLKMLTRLHLQNVPNEIMRPLTEVARDYVPKLSAVIQSKFPKPFVMMKLRLARQFSLLLKRLIRCITAGVHAAKVLNNPTEKSMMLNDWLQLDMHELVMREVPCALENSEALIDILDTRLVALFEESPNQQGLGLSRYANFLFELPNRFPKVNPWLFSLLCSNLLTTCIREMSMAGSRSFASWWVVRCWVDEYIAWCFELGGILYGEFRSQFEPEFKNEEIERPLSANTTGNLETQAAADHYKNSFVDLLDTSQSELKQCYGESDWL